MKSLHCVFTVICSLCIEYRLVHLQAIDIVSWTMSHEPWSMKKSDYAGANMCIYLIACLHFIITTGKPVNVECNVSVFSGDFQVVKMPLGGDIDTWLGRVATLWEIFGFYCNENKLKNMISTVNPLMMGDFFRCFNNKFTVSLMHSILNCLFRVSGGEWLKALLNVCCSRYANLCIEF